MAMLSLLETPATVELFVSSSLVMVAKLAWGMLRSGYEIKG